MAAKAVVGTYMTKEFFFLRLMYGWHMLCLEFLRNAMHTNGADPDSTKKTLDHEMKRIKNQAAVFEIYMDALNAGQTVNGRDIGSEITRVLARRRYELEMLKDLKTVFETAK